MVRIKLLTHIICLLIPFMGVAQSLLNSSPIRYNPSFTGMEREGRVSWQMYSVDEDHLHNLLSGDKFFQGIGGGAGFYLNNEFTTKSIEPVFQEFGLSYSPKFILKSKLGLAPGIANQFHIDRKGSLDYKGIVSLLINNENFYAGYKLEDVTHGRFHSLQGGLSFRIQNYKYLFWTLDGNYNIGEIDPVWGLQNQYNLGWGFHGFLLGVGIFDDQYINALIGFNSQKIKIAYAHHFVEANNFLNRHEIMVRYKLQKIDEKERNDVHLRRSIWMLFHKRR